MPNHNEKIDELNFIKIKIFWVFTGNLREWKVGESIYNTYNQKRTHIQNIKTVTS